MQKKRGQSVLHEHRSTQITTSVNGWTGARTTSAASLPSEIVTSPNEWERLQLLPPVTARPALYEQC